MNLIVEVKVVDDVLKFDIVKEFPPVFNPSMVTLSAPLKFMSGAPATVPEIVRAPVGLIVILVQAPAFKLLVPASVVTSSVIVITMFALVWTVPFIARKAPAAFVSDA
jgi:hypothetical protein